VLHHALPYQPQAVLPMLNLTLAFNRGAAFSFLSEMGGIGSRWFFSIFSAIRSVILVRWVAQTESAAWQQRLALSFILGGALGNLIDRVRQGYVIDFIDVYYKQHHWPVFNIADSAICLGAVLLCFSLGQEDVAHPSDKIRWKK
jgi:signal peptidase II